jgi:hypothetical protein
LDQRIRYGGAPPSGGPPFAVSGGRFTTGPHTGWVVR